MTPDQDTAFAFAAARDQTLLEGLALTPAERLQLAESLWRAVADVVPARAPFTVAFASFDAYRRWQDEGHDVP